MNCLKETLPMSSNYKSRTKYFPNNPIKYNVVSARYYDDFINHLNLLLNKEYRRTISGLLVNLCTSIKFIITISCKHDLTEVLQIITYISRCVTDTVNKFIEGSRKVHESWKNIHYTSITYFQINFGSLHLTARLTVCGLHMIHRFFF